MKSDRSCRELAPLLGDLKLPLKRASLILRPPAFLYSFSGEQNCLIAIEAARTSTDYRLGTLMLRHLYLGLDYKHNDIVLGLNPAANDVYFDGKAHDPYNNAPTLITVIVCILVFGGVASLYWYNKKCSDGSRRAMSVVDVDDAERKRQLEALVTTPAIEASNAKLAAGINDSVVDSDVEALDKEDDNAA